MSNVANVKNEGGRALIACLSRPKTLRERTRRGSSSRKKKDMTFACRGAFHHCNLPQLRGNRTNAIESRCMIAKKKGIRTNTIKRFAC